MSKDILEEIIAHKRIEIEQAEKDIPAQCLEKQLKELHRPISLKQSLAASSTGIIAEFKRRSPSKGWINRYADPAQIPLDYQNAGATAVSILTDTQFFGGSMEDIRTARPTIGIPILRKDFIISRYQLLQAKNANVDAVLLIASALKFPECRELASIAHDLKMEVLLELHDESELDYLESEPDVIGINNRHLGSFATNIANSMRMSRRLPKGHVCISESGISSPRDILCLRQAGFNGFLIGETFMKTANPGFTLRQFIQSLEP